MKRRWKKFLAGVLSAALALNLAAPLALADGVACRVTKVFVYPDHVGRVNSVNVNCIQGEVSYNQGVLTFDGDVTLTTAWACGYGDDLAGRSPWRKKSEAGGKWQGDGQDERQRH